MQVVDKNIKYQRYLEAVVEEDPDLQETSDLLNRHTTLVTTNMDLKQLQRQNMDEMERVRAEISATLKRHADETLNKNNKIAQLKKELERTRLRATDQEAVKDSSLQVTSQNTLQYGQVLPPLRAAPSPAHLFGKRCDIPITQMQC